MNTTTLAMSRVSRRLFSSALALAFVGVSTLAPTFAAMSVGATPLKVVLDAAPGETKPFEIQAINRNDQKVTYKVELKDAKAADEEGNASFQDAKPEDKTAVPNWITMKSKEITVEANSMAPVKFDMTVPKDATPGGHYGMVLLSPANAPTDKGNVGIVGQIGVPLLVKVAGDIKEIGQVEKFSLNDDKLRDENPISFQIKFKNSGNVHVLPEGKIYLKANGQQLTKIAKVKHTDGSEEVVDYLPLNPGKGYALPNSDRIYEASWELNKQYTNVTANYELIFGKEKPQTLTGEQNFAISKNLSIEKFGYNAEKEEFTAVLKNNGNVQMPLRGQVNVYSEAGGDAKVTISAPLDATKLEYLKAGESKDLKIPWNGLKVLSPSENNKFNAIFSYVVDANAGKTLTSKANLPTGAQGAMFGAFLNADNTLPYVVIGVLLIGIIAVVAIRKPFNKK